MPSVRRKHRGGLGSRGWQSLRKLCGGYDLRRKTLSVNFWDLIMFYQVVEQDSIAISLYHLIHVDLADTARGNGQYLELTNAHISSKSGC